MLRDFRALARPLASLADDEAGFILSGELVLILTIGVLSMVVGLNACSKSVVQELNDVAQAIGAVEQTFYYKGMRGHKACVNGSCFNDSQDECDCAVIKFVGGNVKQQWGHGSESDNHH
jgi:hypothetical protein